MKFRENYFLPVLGRHCAVFDFGRAVVSGGFSARAAVGALHDFGPGRRTFARHDHQKPSWQSVLFLWNSRRRTFAMDILARLAVAAVPLADVWIRPTLKDGWLLLNVWAIFTFALFSFSHAKLPAYILPIFPALAVLLALRFFSGERAAESAPRWVWRVCLGSSLILPAIFPFLMKFAFHDGCRNW